MAVILYVTADLSAPVTPVHATVFLAASLAIVGAGRLSDRLWDTTALPALGFTGPRLCVLTRLPYRFIGGGMAFTVILLAAKKMGIIPINDIPVSDLFMTGGILSVSFYGAREGWKFYRGTTRDKNRAA